MCELTRLVLRLPEVDSLLQRAGLQPTSTRLEPTSVLEMFVKVRCCLFKVSTKVHPVALYICSELLWDLVLKEALSETFLLSAA